MALRIAQGQWEKYLTLELARTRNRVEDMYAIVSKFQFAKIGGQHTTVTLEGEGVQEILSHTHTPPGGL